MTRRRRYLRALGPAFLLTFGGAYALASWNWCGDWPLSPPDVSLTASARGELRAGAGRREVLPPYPVVPAGYGPLVGEVRASERPLYARAVVLEVGAVRVGLVSLDALSTSHEVVQQLRASTPALGLTDVWVTATHTHTSFGGYDDRLVAELSGIGRYRDQVRDAYAGAALASLRDAIASLQPVQLQSGAADVPGLVRHRSGDAADARLTRAVLAGPAKPVAELWIWSAHPTLAARPTTTLSPDYPGWVEAGETPVVLLQGAVGNASAVVPEGEGSAPERYARALSDAARSVSLKPADPSVFLGISRVVTRLPRPDASRVVPGVVRAVGDNFLCGSAEHVTELSALRLGALTLVAVPGEPSLAAARVIEEQSGATRVVSVANGYLGYVEPEQIAREGGGESKRQYYAPALLNALTAAAELAVRAAAP